MDGVPIRILIAEDHVLIRTGLKYLLDSNSEFKVVAEASNGREALEMVREYNPAMIVMDLLMPEMDGIEATRQILREFPAMKVLMISNEIEQSVIDKTFASGALGFISKLNALQVPNALREINDGRPFIGSTSRARTSQR